MEEYVKREQYLNRLIVRRDNGMIKTVIGPRRAGKSFLLNPIFKDYLLGLSLSKTTSCPIVMRKASTTRACFNF